MRLSKDMRAMMAHLDEVVRTAVAGVVADCDARAQAYGDHMILLTAELKAAKADNAFLITSYDERIADLQVEVEEFADVVQARDEALSWVRELETALDKVADDRRAVKAERDKLRAELDSTSADVARLIKARDQLRLDLAQERTASGKLYLEHEDAKAEIKRLKAAASKTPPSGQTQAPAGFPPKQASGGYKTEMTPLAARIVELAGKGYSDRYICDVVNNGAEPPRWLNAAGVAAIRELLIGRAA